jgi:site-specific recombinase XerD
MRKVITYTINSAWRTNDKLFIFPHAGARAHSRSGASVASRGEIPTTLGIDKLVEDLKSEYKEKNRKSIGDLEARWEKHLKPAFRNMRATDISTDRIRRYSDMRREQGAVRATINRELSIIKRAFNLALESTPPKVKTVPYIPMQEESNTRTGFLKEKEYSRLASECAKVALWLRALLAVAYNFG